MEKEHNQSFLVEEYDFKQLSTGDLLRESVAKNYSSLGLEISEIMNSGELVPDDIVIQLIVEKISQLKNKKIIFDGFPRKFKSSSCS